MTMPFRTAEESVIREVIDEYVSAGYVVEEQPKLSLVPGAAPVDMIARRGDETVYIELKRGRAPLGSEIVALIEAIREVPNSRVDVVGVPDLRIDLPGRDEVHNAIEQCQRLSLSADKSSRQAAYLLLTSALESVLRELAYRSRLSIDRLVGIAAIGDGLRSVAVISTEQLRELRSIDARRSMYVHGFSLNVEISPGDFEQCFQVLDEIFDNAFMDPSEIVEWFFSNYKDPADGVPYNSREGGYLYINGGPYEASDVIAEHFPYVPEMTLDAAVEEIGDHGSDWVGVGEY